MNNNPIGIMDSGVGGLSVWREIVRELPQESTIYIADSKNVPYGPREPDEIYYLAKRLVNFLIDEQAKIIIIACNTITVSCLDRLRVEYPNIPIIGTVPVVKKAAEVTQNKKIGILSTTRTAESVYQKELIRKFAHDCEVTNIGTDSLVPLIERGETGGEEVRNILRDVLKPVIETRCDVLALGCTHYPFIEQEIKGILGETVQLLEPSGAIARHAKRILIHNNSLASAGDDPDYIFTTTGDPAIFGSVIHTLVGDQLTDSIYGVDSISI